MKKELIAYIETNEKDEFIRVSRVDDGTNQFVLLALGPNKMVVNVSELTEAIGAIGHYSALFEQEEKIRAMRKNTPPPVMEVPITIPTVKAKGKSRAISEDEGALVLEAQATRTGPTASELALEKQMGLMTGETLVFKEK